jgi:hypothetical protein
MRVTIIKHTDIAAARRANKTTVRKDFASKATLDDVYTWMHSPVRTQIFEIILEDIPTFVSVHLVRHTKQHPQPFVTSHRIDRGGDGTEDRYTPVDMTIWANAEAILEMARLRLCHKASKETRDVMWEIVHEIARVDPYLARHMVPSCVTQGGYCREPKPCGEYRVKRYDPTKIWQSILIQTEAE